ncbi:MAG: hypothetical protein RBR93_11885 [Aliarcobacter butzleri]|nr:hypothetical protein [Aliarcobacter butzleri]
MKTFDTIKKEIYHILKDCDVALDFERSEKHGKEVYVYSENKSISIMKLNKNKKVYSYDYFFNKDKSIKDNLPEYECFVGEICEIDNSLNCCNDITEEEWVVLYGNTPILRLIFLNILNPSSSSIDFTIPTNLDIFDFEFTILAIINEKSRASKSYEAKRMIDNKVRKKESSCQNFLDKC